MDICIIYASEDESVAGLLVALLKKHWDVWWAKDINKGDWEEAVKNAVNQTKSVVAIISTQSVSKHIFKDELSYANKIGRDIFPFVIEKTDLPLGYNYLNRTDAYSWMGQINHEGYQLLLNKLSKELGHLPKSDVQLGRMTELMIGNKLLRIPCFAFSLSSHETQINPKDGVDLLRALNPPSVLLSAYDVWKLKGDKRFMKSSRSLNESKSVFFLDSGNYEASRKGQRYSSRANPEGWKRKEFDAVVAALKPDLVFTFDNPDPKNDIKKITKLTIDEYSRETKIFAAFNSKICPIIHLPKVAKADIKKMASKILFDVAKAVDPIMLAIPERELGDGICTRAETVKAIRNSLNKTGKYYPLHILGTGNPISMVVLASAGADSFDGLEWCRTAADYTNGHLFHFQHFDLLKNKCIGQIHSSLVRQLVESSDVPYAMKVASFNLDYYLDWVRTMQDMIHSGQTEYLLRNTLPSLGTDLYNRLYICNI